MQRHEGVDRRWPLPTRRGDGWEPGEAVSGDVVACNADALIDRLDEQIFRLEPADDGVGGAAAAAPDEDGLVRLAGGRLLAPTAWTVPSAARLALDLAEHVVGDAADVTVPGGKTLREVLNDARAVLTEEVGTEHHGLDRLHERIVLRRLKHEGGAVGDAAFSELALKDADADVLDDPVWTAIASVRDAVFATVEAVQYARDRRRSEREGDRFEEDLEKAGGVTTPGPTAGFGAGPISVHRGPRAGWAPAWVAAMDTAERARQAAEHSGGADAASAERAFQVERLTYYLSASS
jgi:hypothetical protein